nr:biopolymer transporter Tol [Candidatus Pantoea persica]
MRSTAPIEEGWTGTRGYQRPDVGWQRWAIAFIGDTLSASGEKRPEVFIVDLPEALEAYARPGEAPLVGTETQLPAPPAGVRQRRLTFTCGLAQLVQSAFSWHPQGDAIAFISDDRIMRCDMCSGGCQPLTDLVADERRRGGLVVGRRADCVYTRRRRLVAAVYGVGLAGQGAACARFSCVWFSFSLCRMRSRGE